MATTVTGLREITAALQATHTALHRALGTAVAGAALLVESEMKRSLQQGPKSGRLYRRGSITKTRTKGLAGLGLRRVKGQANRVIAGANFHRASAPGEAPATDTGYLVNHISAAIDQPRLRALVGVQDVSVVIYAPMLEFGTIHMAARPFVAPAWDKKKAEVAQRIATVTAQVLKTGGR
jgi:HK97 gp10 family phage protein